MHSIHVYVKPIVMFEVFFFKTEMVFVYIVELFFALTCTSWRIFHKRMSHSYSVINPSVDTEVGYILPLTK